MLNSIPILYVRGGTDNLACRGKINEREQSWQTNVVEIGQGWVDAGDKVKDLHFFYDTPSLTISCVFMSLLPYCLATISVNI